MLFFSHPRAGEKSLQLFTIHYMVNLSILGLAKCMENSRLVTEFRARVMFTVFTICTNQFH